MTQVLSSSLQTQPSRRRQHATFGGVVLPDRRLSPHFLFIGTAGSGKTLCIRQLLKSYWGSSGQLPGRCMIYDGKREYLPMLTGMGVSTENIYIMNAADRRCVAWDLAGDISGRDDAFNIVMLLIPDAEGGRDNPFFPQAVRSLVTEVIMTYHAQSPGKWRFKDIVDVSRTPERLQKFLSKTQRGREVCARYFTAAKEAVGGIISTIDARFIAPYDSISSIWAKADRSMRLTDWINGHSAILLGYDANRAGVDRINQVLFQRAAQLTMSLPEGAGQIVGETWFVLDELRFMGELPLLGETISFGRTKGGRFIIGLQDLDGAYDVMGENAANQLIALCGNVGVLRIDSVKTREWAAKLFGDYEAWEIDTGGSTTTGTSVNDGKEGSSYGQSDSRTFNWNRKLTKREAVLSSEFFCLPETNRANGMHGFFATPCMGAWRGVVPTEFIDAHLPKDDPNTMPFEPRPPEVAEDMLPMTPENAAQLAPQTPSGASDGGSPHHDGASPQEKADDDTIMPEKPKTPKKRSKKRRGDLPSW